MPFASLLYTVQAEADEQHAWVLIISDHLNIEGITRRGIIVYLEYQSVCPFIRIGSPRPLSL